MNIFPPVLQESQAGNSTPPVDAAVYRRVRTATACAFLATAVITSICVAVAALPLLPVLLAGLTLGAALAAVCVLSIYRLKKLDGAQKTQETLPEPPRAEVVKPQDEVPKKEGSQSESGPSADPNAGPNGAQQTTGTENDPNKDPSSPLGDPEDLPEPHQTSPGDMPEHPVDAPRSPDEDPQALPINPDDNSVVDPGEQPAPPGEDLQPPLINPKDGPVDDPGEVRDLQPSPIELEDDPVDEVLFTYQVDSGGTLADCSRTLSRQVSIPKTAKPVDINSPAIADELSRAKSLHFHGMEDGKFLFVCSPEAGGAKNGTYFCANNIEDVWAKLKSVTHFRFLCKPQGDFQISGDNVPNLERITFFSDDIEEIEIAKHLTGSFDKLERITFRRCTNMRSAKVNGNWKAGKLKNITFENCSAVDDIHVGSDLSSKDYINKHVHTYPKECTFGDGNKFSVSLFDCQKMFEKERTFSTITVINDTISGTTHYSGMSDVGITIMCLSAGTFETNGSIQKANNISTISLQMTDMTTDFVNISEASIEPHMVMNLNLKRCISIRLPTHKPIKHLELSKPIADCFVEFEAPWDGTLLDIKEIPQTLPGDTGQPLNMSFKSLEGSGLPEIKLNGNELNDITWYKSERGYSGTFLIPVIRGNLEKANGQKGWAPLKGVVWNRGETVELNSDFLFATAES
jgi:hypothetical protein